MPPILPDFSNSVKIKYVKLGYQYLVNHILYLLLIPVMVGILIEVLRLGPDEILSLWRSLHFDTVQILCSSFLVIFIATVYFMSKPRTIYLVDYACYKPPVTCRVPFSTFMEHSRLILKDNPKSVEFQMRILERSGLGEETCLPPAIHYIPPKPTMEAARGEAELVIFSAMDSLFKKTGLKPKDIDILIVNCSLFSPTPSLSAMVINKYKLRSNIKSFNLSGYIEAKGRMRRGDRVWQIAFGSGFKCNSAVWKCNRTIKTPTDSPWADCIDRYPVHIPELAGGVLYPKFGGRSPHNGVSGNKA
ncbi:hypothetical protein D5086_020004 [Populus alba]|uniref:Uncharacterized protein n=1 Tax=Populus alba TaxID=43335 RepID=A0ACC4BJF4_POPAL